MSKGTTPRAVRVPDELWDAAVATATERGETVSGAIRAFLEEYVAGRKQTTSAVDG